MKPTFYLRFVEVEHKNSTPLCCSFDHREPEWSRLQQWWEDETGNGEWRFVEIDFSDTNERPY